MEQLAMNYAQYKTELDTEIKKNVEGFVKIGYLLKVARDTDVLRESGYSTVSEFAHAEYGLTKDIVSRYIAINDKYSVDGYSLELKEEYSGFGVAKLAEMLTLPDSIVTEMSPELTKKEIQEIKAEVREEEKISELEVYLEGKDMNFSEMNLLELFFYQYLYENMESYVSLWTIINKVSEYATGHVVKDKILDVLAPSGIGMLSTRVKGIGKLMLSVNGLDNDIAVINIREDNKEKFSWDTVVKTLHEILINADCPESSWEKKYNEPCRKDEVAPVQLETDNETEEIITETEENSTETEEMITETSENCTESSEIVTERVTESRWQQEKKKVRFEIRREMENLHRYFDDKDYIQMRRTASDLISDINALIQIEEREDDEC